LSAIFSVPQKPIKNSFDGYGLIGNPFTVDAQLANLSAQDGLPLFHRIICAVEIERLAKLLAGEVAEGRTKPVWFLENPAFGLRFNNVVEMGVFRYLITDRNPRMLPVYIPLPQVAGDFTGNAYKLIVDRLLPRYFRNVIYAFVCHELEAAAGGGGGLSFDAAPLLKEIDKTAGQALDEIFFGKAFSPTVAEEYGVVLEEQDVPTAEAEKPAAEEPEFVDHDAEEETIEAEEAVEAEEAEEVRIDERREPLVNFINDRLADETSGAGATLRQAVAVSLSSGFVKGRLALESSPSPRDEILGLVKLVAGYYDGLVMLIDQIDPWPFMSEQERINFLSDIYNFELASGGKAMIVVISDQEKFDGFDAAFKDRCRIEPIELKWTNEKDIDFGRDETKAEEFIAEFLGKARADGDPGLEPFTAPAIAAVMKKTDGEILAAIEIFGRLVEKGRVAGFARIDEAFVKKAD
jgi:hypothetical protein